MTCFAHATNKGLVRNGDGTATLTFETTGPNADAQTAMETSAVCIIRNIVIGGPGSRNAEPPQPCKLFTLTCASWGMAENQAPCSW